MFSFEIVTFYVDRSGSALSDSGKLRGIDQIDLLYRSALATNPNVVLTVLTCTTTDLSGLRFPHRRIAMDIDPARLMYERTRMQADFVRRVWDRTTPIAFLDSDILLARDISPGFAADFDIALTWRHNPVMPINGSLILMNNRRPSAGQRFFERLEEIYREKWARQAHWNGDQRALADVVGLSLREIAVMPGHVSRSVRLSFLPSETHYVTPKRLSFRMDTKTAATFIYHFGRDENRLMASYWRYHLSPNRPSALFRSVRIALDGALLIARHAMERVRKWRRARTGDGAPAIETVPR